MRKILHSLLAGFLVAGCVRFEPRPISPEQTAARFEQRSGADAALRQFVETHLHRVFQTWPPAEWDLETLTLAAFYFNPDLAVARARHDTVTAGEITAAQRPNPTASVSPVYNSTKTVPTPWLVSASLDVPIETAGKRDYRRAQAQHLSAAARFGLATAAWDVRSRLRQAMLELWAARAGESLLREQQAAQESLVGLLEKEQAAGGISPTAAARERIALQQARLAWLEAGNREVQARVQLAGVIGLPPRALDGMAISFAVFDRPPPDLPAAEARRRALFNRTDILGALADYAASESALQLEIARQYPDVHLSPGYEFDQGDNKWGLGLSLELPVLNRNRGPIAEAAARRRESAARFEALQARVFGEIEAALAGCQYARQMFAASASLLDQSQRQERATLAMFRAGEVSPQAVAAARLETATTALAQLDLRLKAQQAVTALEAALQSPLELPTSLLAPLPGPSPPP